MEETSFAARILRATVVSLASSLEHLAREAGERPGRTRAESARVSTPPRGFSARELTSANFNFANIHDRVHSGRTGAV